MSKKKKETGNIDLGAHLQKARRSLKVRIEDAVKETKIRATYIKAMESGDLDSLPGGVYTKGYLKTYAEFLKLDPDDVIERMNRVEKEAPSSASDQNMVSEPYREEFSPSLMIIVSSIVIAIVAYSVWHKFYAASDEIKDERAQKVIGVFSNPDPVITLVANDKVKLKIEYMDGSALYEKEMDYGDTYFLPNKEEVIMTAETPEAIEIYLDGEKVSSFSNLEEKSGGLVLDVEKLLANLEIH